ncbi:MAG TPA: prepilin-type N-terminal cleavage/methylation domain-containing protein [Rickettsiales bacterium]|nr:prepilin-type N-terminal cleavage/methylation domain-containing protein [Rickettsiales bacterium]
MIHGRNKHSGFTLMEMTVVIVIIGLLAGGVVAGQSLIKTSEIASVMTDVNRFRAAINAFDTQYNALPGDMSNASSYWSTANNGDGNGKINYNSGAWGSEEYYVWQHLQLANILPGTYGTSTATLPRSRLRDGYYRVSYQTGVYGKSAHMISLNKWNSATNLANTAILSPKDVYEMDRKYDDGSADTGRIMGFNEQGVPGCVTNDYTVGYGSYLNTSDAIKCKIFFLLDERDPKQSS